MKTAKPARKVIKKRSSVERKILEKDTAHSHAEKKAHKVKKGLVIGFKKIGKSTRKGRE